MGRDIWPVLTAGASSPHEYVALSERPQLAIRQAQWKLVVNGVTHDDSPAGDEPLSSDDAVFLSNVDEDPAESRNLRHQFPQIADQLQTLLQGWLKSVETK